MAEEGYGRTAPSGMAIPMIPFLMYMLGGVLVFILIAAIVYYWGEDL